jgi:hypothetical protein
VVGQNVRRTDILQTVKVVIERSAGRDCASRRCI